MDCFFKMGEYGTNYLVKDMVDGAKSVGVASTMISSDVNHKDRPYLVHDLQHIISSKDERKVSKEKEHSVRFSFP